MDNLDNKLRILAKSSYWQALYRASQKCSFVSLFENAGTFSGLQVRFLYWLNAYQLLYDELSTFEDSLLTENVIEDNFRCDSYLAYRNKKHEFSWKKHRQEEEMAKRKASRKKPFKHPGKESTIEVDLRREQ